MDSKQKAINDLKKQMLISKQQLGPEGLKALQDMARNMVPSERYDKEAAMKAFELFLANHGDPAEFERRLRALIAQKNH